MRALVVGASGDIGKAVVKELAHNDIEVVSASKSSGDIQVDISSSNSIEEMYQKAGPLDAVISAPGRGILFKPVSEMSKEDYQSGFEIKLLGQMDLVLIGLNYLNKKGSFTLTSGIMTRDFIPKGSCAALVNHAIEGFVKSASLELPKQMRLNVVSPNLLKESEKKYEGFFLGFDPIPAKKAALAYIRSLGGILNGRVLEVY